MSPLPDRPRAAARPLLARLRPAAGHDRSHVYAVHPGALAASAWAPAAAALPEGAAFGLLDLQLVPEYFAAVFAPERTVIGIEELAARCLAELTAARPADAPFALVGWSFGGVVAFEMARQAERAGLGELLTDLVLLDSIAPVPDYQRGEELLEPEMLLRWFAMYLAAKREQPLDWQPGPVAERRLPELLAAATAQGVLPADTELPGLRKLFDTYLAGLRRNNRFALAYRPGALDRTITLLKPADSLLPNDGSLGWDQLSTRPLRHLDVAGDHYTMLRQPANLAVLAELLAEPAAV
ncbi:thioesterase domain-containing protein [Kitasatospora sp. MAP12-15]|uniref:thioesterase domain-containing protein n=1 Tax=unclassified Kitasatospora TaxID=2633591 RepID=UPI0035119436